MDNTLNEIKKRIYHLILELNENHIDIQNSTSKFIFFSGIRATYYLNTRLYSIKEMNDEIYKEISNRYILKLMTKNLEDLCRTKRQTPSLKIKRLAKK